MAERRKNKPEVEIPLSPRQKLNEYLKKIGEAS